MAGPALVVVDVQERLFAAMDAECRDEVAEASKSWSPPPSAWDSLCW